MTTHDGAILTDAELAEIDATIQAGEVTDLDAGVLLDSHRALLAAHDAVRRERDETEREMAAAMAEMAAKAARAYQGLSERASAAEALAETRGRAAEALLREKATLEARLAALEAVARRAVREVCALACRPPDNGEQCYALTAGLRDALGGGRATT